MTRYEPVAFTDITKGDTIKSVSPCGTVRKGVVAQVNPLFATDAANAVLARREWTLYRRTPKPAKFVPLDVPEVGQWIEATLRDGRVETFQVAGVFKRFDYYSINSGRGMFFIDKTEPKFGGHPDDILFWTPTTLPAPPEPTGFGYVGYTNNGDEWQVNRYTVSGEVLYERVRLRDGRIEPDQLWEQIVEFGTFAEVSR